MTNIMTRAEFALLMSEAAQKFPTSAKGDVNADVKFNNWLKASDILATVGQPFATCPVEDETSEDGFKTIRLRTLADMPAEIKRTVQQAMRELEVVKIRG